MGSEAGRRRDRQSKNLDGQNQRVDISAQARTAHKDLLQKRLEENLCWIVDHVRPRTQSVQGLDWTELNLGS